MENRVKRRLNKVLTMIEKGTPGEKRNAQIALDKALSLHGITIDEIKDTLGMEIYEFRISNDLEKKLLYQITAMVANRDDVGFYRILRTRKKAAVKLTKLEHIEISAMFDYYSKAFQAETEILLHAFVQKHDIFGDQQKENKELTFDEMAKFTRISKMMGGILDSQYVPSRRQIT